MRYAILHHTGIDHPHYDLLFETSPSEELAAWRSDIWPITRPATLTRLPDHRRIYLDYEGPVSNNRGHVARVEAGSCTICQDAPDRWRIVLSTGIMLILDHQAGETWQAAVSPANPTPPS